MDLGHHGDTRLETRQAKGEVREQEGGGKDHRHRVAERGKQAGSPRPEDDRVCGDLHQADANDSGIQREVDDHEADGKTDGLLEAFQEHGAKTNDQREGNFDRVVVKDLGREWVLDDVRRRIGGRQGDRDDPRCGGEAKQGQNERLPLPPR